MKTWGFEASNVAIAQVRIEQQLAKAAADVGLTGASVTTDSEVEVIGPTQWLTAEVQADLRWNPVFGFLDRVATWPEGFRVAGFSYEILEQGLSSAQAPTGGKVRVQLAFPVILPLDAVEQEGGAG